MTRFQPGRSASFADDALKSALHDMDRAKQCALLWFDDIRKRKLFRKLGYSSINTYAQQELGFSRTRTGDFLQLCQKLEKLPRIRKEIADGALGYTKARVLVKLAEPESQDRWLAEARRKSRRQLEQEVRKARRDSTLRRKRQPALLEETPSRAPDRKPDGPATLPRARIPVRLGLEMSPEQFARYEALWEKIRRQGSAPADQVEALLEMMAAYIEDRMPPRGDIPAGEVDGQTAGQAAARPAPPVQIHVHLCPECGKATVQTRRGELELPAADLGRARCDNRTSRPGGRNTASIPPGVRRRVLARDRHRCRRLGCHHTRFLEVHHLVPREIGGSNDPGNLVTLCAGCHRLWHELGPEAASRLPLREP